MLCDRLARLLLAAGAIAAALPTGGAAQEAPPSREPAIPWIDLPVTAHDPVVIDREPGQYLGHPSTLLLEDGQTILCVYPQGHGKGAILSKRSLDGGRSWSERLPTPENWSTSLETPTLFRLVDRDGTRRILLFSGLYPIRQSISSDDGRSWSPLEPIGEFGGIVAMSSLIPLGDGRALALFHDDGRFLTSTAGPRAFRVYGTRTEDGGQTWSTPEMVAERADADLCEPGAVRSPDGRQIAVLLRENSRKHNSFVIFSDDEGGSWSPPRELPAELTGDRHVAAYTADGRLLVSFRDMAERSPTRGDWVAWIGTYDDLRQGGRGSYRVRLMDNRNAWDCGYSGVERLGDGTIVATSYGHWDEGEPPYVVCRRLRMDELDARQLELSRGEKRR